MTDKPEINQSSYQKFDRSVSLLCWAYNEEALIGEFLEKAAKLMASNIDDYEIILIEDGSSDRTYEIAKSFQMGNNKLTIFQNGKNLNVGFSSRRAIALASKDYLFWQTIDWSYDIPNLRLYIEYLKEWDIVQGVRRRPVEVKVRWLKPLVALFKIFGLKHLTKRSDTVPKALVSVINYILIRILFRVPLSDFQNITFYPTKWIQSIQLEAKSSFANPEGLIKSYWAGMNIKEVPIHFIPRKEGVAKGTGIKAIITSVQDIFQLWFKWVVLKKRGQIQKGRICRVGANDSFKKKIIGLKIVVAIIIAGDLFYRRRLAIKIFYHLLNSANISLMLVAGATRLVAPYRLVASLRTIAWTCLALVT